MRFLPGIIFIALIVLSMPAMAEVQSFTSTHTYILGDHDSKDDARQRCLLEAKRKVLEQAGVFIESASETKDFQVTKDKIASFAAAVMQIKDTKEELGFQQGHITLTLTIRADVDPVEVQNQLKARQVDVGVRDEVAQHKERLKSLEAQLDAMQRQLQGKQVAGSAPSVTNSISSDDLKEYEAAAARGDSRAQFALGFFLQMGLGVPRDYVKARQWYERSAAQGADAAQFALGALYVQGLGVPRDYVKARQWYEHAAIQGHAWAQAALGALYDHGMGVAQDYAKAAYWYEKSASQGNANAQVSIGYLYEEGLGVQQDYVRARQWWEQAALQGQAEAYTFLGGLYAMGRGVSRDFAKARQWWEQAATQGQAQSMAGLGLLYREGLSVQQDYVRAHMWYSLAAAHSDDSNKNHVAEDLERIARRMTSVQIAEAHRLAQQCEARKFVECQAEVK